MMVGQYLMLARGAEGDKNRVGWLVGALSPVNHRDKNRGRGLT